MNDGISFRFGRYSITGWPAFAIFAIGCGLIAFAPDFLSMIFN